MYTSVMGSKHLDCLRSSELCDFDQHPEIRAKALELTTACHSRAEKLRRLFGFVKELPYGLEDWDVAASETLAKGWGMCSAKANLLVALLRSLGIPARYRVYRIRGEVSLWGKVTGDRNLVQRLGAAPTEQDHVDCEVWLGKWTPCDPARDTPMERGMRALRIPLERQVVPDASGRASYTVVAVLDEWARERQARRLVRVDRAETFARVNEQLQRMRELGERGSDRRAARNSTQEG